MVKIVKWLVPSKDEEDEKFELKYIKAGLVSVDEIALVQAKNEIIVFIERTLKMYNLVKNLHLEKSEKQIEKIIRKVTRYEEIADRIEEEIANFLTKASSAELSVNSSETINSMLKLVSRIESLNDALHNTAQQIHLKKQKKMNFNEEMIERLNKLFSMLDENIKELPLVIKKKTPNININEKRQQRDEIDAYIEKLNLWHLKDIKKGVYKYKVGIVYCDIFNELESVGNHTYHVLKYINEINI